MEREPDEVTSVHWGQGLHVPDDARRMGLTHHVPDGALLDFAGSLDPAKPRHLVAAWVMLFVFGMPVLLMALRVVYLL
ncbi:hypothetical protein [Nocardioides sp. SR21]|uniref:hypothetical protein n=1 Tax=Nocardioides sp. SR21 TaxID=2919501 RepID=UPI001FA96BB2|nr:hypothetical protein [Nocardioides sp. SR21]